MLINAGEDPLDAWDRTTEAVGSLIACGTRPLILGGGGAITYAALRAFPSERLGVVHFDARPDLSPIDPVGLDDTNVFSHIVERFGFVGPGLGVLAPEGDGCTIIASHALLHFGSGAADARVALERWRALGCPSQSQYVIEAIPRARPRMADEREWLVERRHYRFAIRPPVTPL